MVEVLMLFTQLSKQRISSLTVLF